MSYPPAGPSGPPPHQPITQHQPAPADKPKSLLGMSLGLVLALIGAMLTLCCICTAAGVFVWQFMPSVYTDLVDSPGEGDSMTKVTSCDINDLSSSSPVVVEYEFTNRTASKANFSIDIEVRTTDGYLVGETTDWALGVEAGQTVTRSINFRVFGAGGKTCVAKVRA